MTLRAGPYVHHTKLSMGSTYFSLHCHKVFRIEPFRTTRYELKGQNP
jgi:hypothetical protein